MQISICALLLLGSFVNVQARSPIVKEEFLSSDIPHFDCHSSSLVETVDGSLCAVWKGGSGEGKSNIDMKEGVGIWSSLFDGNSWSEPTEIVSQDCSICWNPVICKHPSGELFLFYRVGPNPRNTVSFLKTSANGGVSWSEAEMLPAGVTGPTKNKPLVTSEGHFICPSSVCVGEPNQPFKATACWLDISEDRGVHWRKVGPVELPDRKFGVIEPALFVDVAGHLHMLCRDRAHKIHEEGFIWESISEDGGNHWSELRKTGFPNPDSAFDVVDLGEGKIVLVYNHSHTDRFPLNIAFSLDGGEHWSQPIVLDDVGEFPAVIATADGLMHITYAFPSSYADQRRIKHVVVNPQVLYSDCSTAENGALLTLSTVSACPMTETVIGIESLSGFPMSHPKNTLVLFDVDDTLLDFPHMVGSKKWRHYLQKKVKQWNTNENWRDIFTLQLAQRYPVTTAEPITSQLVKELQDRGYTVCGLTGRGRDKWYHTPQEHIDVLTVNQLHSVGIHLNDARICEIYPYFATTPEYFNGTFFSDDDTKGDFLLKLFENAPHLPEKVIFIDDKMTESQSVAEALAKLGIPYESYCYTHTDIKAQSFDPLIANIQLYYFYQSKQMLTDEEAARISLENPAKSADDYLKAALDLAANWPQ